jgi:putative toxin-antitoxin system antitoxin component (TIGR02293 family)
METTPRRSPTRKSERTEDAPPFEDSLQTRIPAFFRFRSISRGKLAKHPKVRAGEAVTELTGLQAHDLVIAGLLVEQARQLLRQYKIIQEKDLLVVLGITTRTMQRRAASAKKTLDPNASDRAIRLATITAQAIDVLGSQEAAEKWLSTPAMALDQRKPIDLLQSSEGSELVKTLLTRIDYGVYA